MVEAADILLTDEANFLVWLDFKDGLALTTSFFLP